MSEDLITLDEATKRYNYNRWSFLYQAKKGRLTFYKRLGDKKLYLRVGDLEQAFSFQPVSKLEAAAL